LFTVSLSFAADAFQGIWGPGPAAHNGNIFSNYSPASTYVGIFPGYRGGNGNRYYYYGNQGSAFEQMGTYRENYQNPYYRNSYYRGSYYNYPPQSFFMLNSAWGRGRFRQENLYSSDKFVQEWKDRAPVKKEASGLEDSPILSPGMNEDEVVFVLGTPLQRIRFEGKEIWKYSSFSLVFDNGKLTELR
jgi:hypothetical protein